MDWQQQSNGNSSKKERMEKKWRKRTNKSFSAYMTSHAAWLSTNHCQEICMKSWNYWMLCKRNAFDFHFSYYTYHHILLFVFFSPLVFSLHAIPIVNCRKNSFLFSSGGILFSSFFSSSSLSSSFNENGKWAKTIAKTISMCVVFRILELKLHLGQFYPFLLFVECASSGGAALLNHCICT